MPWSEGEVVVSVTLLQGIWYKLNCLTLTAVTFILSNELDCESRRSLIQMLTH